jgi:hypothetical protein
MTSKLQPCHLVGIALLLVALSTVYNKAETYTVSKRRERFHKAPSYELKEPELNGLYTSVGELRSRVDQELDDVLNRSSVLRDWSQDEKQAARQAAHDALSSHANSFRSVPSRAQLYRAYDDAQTAFNDAILQLAAKRGDPVLSDDPLRLTRGIDFSVLRGGGGSVHGGLPLPPLPATA